MREPKDSVNPTKEKILFSALRLFAQNGYEAVSVSQIAGTLGMTKGALYKHYQNKRDIFNQIVARMERMDAENARRFTLPEGLPDQMAQAYRQASLKQLLAFSLSQFRYWTEEDFPACFRKLLTLEQYRSQEMNGLYQQYLGAGPLQYVADLFRAWGIAEPETKAAAFYGPMFLAYSLYDGAKNKAAVGAALGEQMLDFVLRLGENL